MLSKKSGKRVFSKNSRQSGSSEAAWWAVLLTALALIFWMLFLYAPAGGGENPFPQIAQRILDGRNQTQDWTHMAVVTTISVVVSAQLLSFVIGVFIGGLGLFPHPLARFLATCYVEAIRGIPIYVMLLFTYFGLTRALPREFLGFSTDLSPFQAAVIALGVCYGAYMAEVVRAGIESIPQSEVEAGMLEGGTLVVLWHIILPQALRTILPAIANECIALLKDSAIVGVVTLFDMTRAAQVYAGSTFIYFETFALLGLFYLVLSLVLSRVQRWLEKGA